MYNLNSNSSYPVLTLDMVFVAIIIDNIINILNFIFRGPDSSDSCELGIFYKFIFLAKFPF